MKIGLDLITIAASLFAFQSQASEVSIPDILALQPTPCVSTSFSQTGGSSWKTISLRLTNQCGASLNFQNSTVTFTNSTPLSTNFWGDFGPLSYPTGELQITSQPDGAGKYLASLSLRFPTESWANTMLPPNSSIVIKYGASTAGYVQNSVNVYLNQSVPNTTGNLVLTNSTSQPVGVSQTSVTININQGTQLIKKVQLLWGTQQTISGLLPGTYDIKPEAISDSQGLSYQGQATPASVEVVANQTISTTISYSAITQTGSIDIQTLPKPAVLAGYNVNPTIILTRNDIGASITKSISWNTTTRISQLVEGATYTFSTSPINYNGSSCVGTFTPSSLTSNTQSPPLTQLSYTCSPVSSTGRIIGYIPGWKAPPAASALAGAGYTHMVVAFAVFSTSQPGQLVSAFDTVTRSYIDSLHTSGIKVLLSIGGAQSGIANTSVNFHDVLTRASSESVFQQTFVQSIKNFVTQYGFDGIDIDIEHGLNASGTFSQPTGDIAVLANILNQLHLDLPSLLITLAPQVANISATSGFDQTWGNYASLIMQTYQSLTWVGIQLYNTGCAFGLDRVCYDPYATSSPNFSVAMAADLLENWPTRDSAGRPTGFQPYVSYLNSNQVVLGYPSPNRQGTADASPVTPTSTIRRAIQCLKTGVRSPSSCDSYVPPRMYPTLGGVFNWEVTYDQDNNFAFARDLAACVLQGNCQ